MEKITHEYRGQKITFDEAREEWAIILDGKEQRHKSLQIIKAYIDRRNKKAFKRVPVFVVNGDGWYDKNKGYEKAEITSIGVDGTVFIVRESRKNAEHCGRAWMMSAENEKRVERIAELQEIRDRADADMQTEREKLDEVSFDKLREQALGVNWRSQR